MSWHPGEKNLITDVPGLKVGNAHDAALRSGVTVLLPDNPAIAAVDMRGGAPGTRETDALAPAGIANEIHGLVLSGGSAFGLDAATGVQSHLRERGIGFVVRTAIVPIVPQAILFDLLNGGDKDWGSRPPYQDLARKACETASTSFTLGTVGAGYGATTQSLKGGLGSASLITDQGTSIGALAAVNPAGNVTIGDGANFWAAPFEIGGEFGGHGLPDRIAADALLPRLKGGAQENTTLAIVATDAILSKSQAQRLAIMAHTGMARAIYPVHTPLDGDIVFTLSTGKRALQDPIYDLANLGTLAANTLARAVARAVYEASPMAGPSEQLPTYREKFGAGRGN
ncbi:putative aminopeptidase [bacterium MnTg02]|nr:putative aminopeptidase [bacterium MnTg02]